MADGPSLPTPLAPCGQSSLMADGELTPLAPDSTVRAASSNRAVIEDGQRSLLAHSELTPLAPDSTAHADSSKCVVIEDGQRSLLAHTKVFEAVAMGPSGGGQTGSPPSETDAPGSMADGGPAASTPLPVAAHGPEYIWQSEPPDAGPDGERGQHLPDQELPYPYAEGAHQGLQPLCFACVDATATISRLDDLESMVASLPPLAFDWLRRNGFQC